LASSAHSSFSETASRYKASWPEQVNVIFGLNSCFPQFPVGELKETPGMPPYYVDEDYPAGPGIIEPLPE